MASEEKKEGTILKLASSIIKKGEDISKETSLQNIIDLLGTLDPREDKAFELLAVMLVESRSMKKHVDEKYREELQEAWAIYKAIQAARKKDIGPFESIDEAIKDRVADELCHRVGEAEESGQPVEKVVPHVDGFGWQTTYSAELVSMADFVQAVLFENPEKYKELASSIRIDMKDLNKRARIMREALRIPGVVVRRKMIPTAMENKDA